jgi:hypothetical protein
MFPKLCNSSLNNEHTFIQARNNKNIQKLHKMKTSKILFHAEKSSKEKNSIKLKVGIVSKSILFIFIISCTILFTSCIAFVPVEHGEHGGGGHGGGGRGGGGHGGGHHEQNDRH